MKNKTFIEKANEEFGEKFYDSLWEFNPRLQVAVKTFWNEKMGEVLEEIAKLTASGGCLGSEEFMKGYHARDKELNQELNSILEERRENEDKAS